MVDLELNELRREFLAEAVEKVQEIDDSITAPGGLERLAYLAHQLKGSGGSYGYARISAEAAEIERVVEQLPQGPIPSTLAERIRHHAGNLRAEIDKSLRGLAGAA